jgi:MFS family permease
VLIIGLFALASLATRLPTGWLLDRGRRVPILVVGAGIFALSYAGYALVASVAALLLVRVFHGTGMAAFTTTGQTLVVDVAPVGRRGEAIGVYGIANNLASALGPAAGMALALDLGFPSLFATSGALALLAIALSSLIAEPATRTTRRPARLFNRAVVGPGVSMLAVMFTYGAVASFVPIHALQRGVANPGLFFTMYALAMVAAQVAAGRASDRFGRSAAILPGLALTALGVLAVAGLNGWWLLAAGGLYGLGAGATQPALYAAAGDLVLPEERGSAMATMGLFLEAGIGFGSIAAGLLAEPLGLAGTFVAVALVPLAGLVAAAATGQARRPARAAAGGDG